MAKSETKSIRRGIRNSYLSSIVSVTLVLFLLGTMGLIMLNAKQLSDNVRETVGFNIFLNENLSDAEVNQFNKALKSKPYVFDTKLTTKREAAHQFSKELGEDFVSFLGNNPLPASITVQLKAQYLVDANLKRVRTEIERMPQVQEVVFQDNLVEAINANVKKVSLILMVFAGLLLFVSLVLINNTIRLAVYARRQIINTMKLVGATSRFIRRPFLLRGVAHGLYAGMFAVMMLVGLYFLAKEEVGDVIYLNNIQWIIILFGAIIGIGVVINFICTYFAVNKFLRLRSDEIHY
jgi:cell division transport system permease protein